MEGGSERRRGGGRGPLPRGDRDGAGVGKRERGDNDRRDERRDNDRRDAQPDQEQHRTGDQDLQEGESLTALKGILAKVASLLKPLQLTPEESIRLVEQLYGSVLEMDVKLAGEADDTRKSSVLSLIQNAIVRREGEAIVVEFPTGEPDAKPEAESKD